MLRMKARIQEIKNKIDDAAQRSGRSSDSIILMGVSKTQPWQSVLDAYSCGITLFGENRVQELTEKFPSDRPHDMQLHLIGHLQSNKVKKVVSCVDAIDSVDSLKLVHLLGATGVPLSLLFECNTSREATKSGFTDDTEYFQALDATAQYPHLTVCGLMTIGPLGGTEKEVRTAFSTLRTLQETSRRLHPEMNFDTLSMGMSNDYLIAIEEGATMVRLGSAIFGERNYQ